MWVRASDVGMRWYHLVVVRGGACLALFVLVVVMTMVVQSRTRPDGSGFALILGATVVGVASGAVGFWCACRTERHGEGVTRRRALAVWVASAPEAVVAVPFALLTALALPFESGFARAGLRGLVADALALYVAVFYGPFLLPTVAQAVATAGWVRGLRRRLVPRDA